LSLKWSLLVALALAPGCSVLSPQGPTEVARGEYYAAGKPEYDSFFIALHQKQVELLAAPQEAQGARSNLAAAVGLTADASDEAFERQLSQEVKKLAGQGLRLRLEVPEPSPALDASATLHTSDRAASTPLRSARPQETTRLVRSRNRMLATKAELEKLSVTGITLEGSVEQAFRTDGPWKRDEVRKNLADGQKVITLMQARAQEVADLDVKLLGLVASAATTDPSLGKGEPEPPPAAEPSKPRRPAPVRATAHPAPAPAPGKPPPKRGDDEAAAPKPVPGNAPAEIEP
jgi:hypothetical protein